MFGQSKEQLRVPNSGKKKQKTKLAVHGPAWWITKVREKTIGTVKGKKLPR